MGDSVASTASSRMLRPRHSNIPTPPLVPLEHPFPATLAALLELRHSIPLISPDRLCDAISAMGSGSDFSSLARSTLCDLVTEWTGQQRPRNLSKQHYINILEETRLRFTTFQFLELPPELRNHIYLELLTLRNRTGHRRGMYCFPDILRTTKQIWKEAESIMYGENTPEVAFSQNMGGISITYEKLGNTSMPVYTMQPRHTLSGPRFAVPMGSHLQPAPTWSSRLARFQNINVTITIRNGDISFSRDLYMFVTGLAASKKVKAVKFNMESITDDQMTSLKDALWPVAFLTSKDDLVITGIPEELMASMKSKTSLLEPLPNEKDLSLHAYDLCNRGQGLLTLREELKGLGQQKVAGSQLRHYVSDIASMLSSQAIIKPLRHAMFVENVRLLEVYLQGSEAKLIRSRALAKVAKINGLLAT